MAKKKRAKSQVTKVVMTKPWQLKQAANELLHRVDQLRSALVILNQAADQLGQFVGQIRVKKLEWRRQRGGVFTAAGCFGFYTLQPPGLDPEYQGAKSLGRWMLIFQPESYRGSIVREICRLKTQLITEANEHNERRIKAILLEKCEMVLNGEEKAKT